MWTRPAGAAGSRFSASFHLCSHQSLLGSRESGNTEELNSSLNSSVSDRRKETLEKAPAGLLFLSCHCMDMLRETGSIFPLWASFLSRMSLMALSAQTLYACDLDILTAWVGPAVTPGDREHRSGAMGGPSPN